MPKNYTSQMTSHLKKIDKALGGRVSKDLHDFTRDFYQKMPVKELKNLPPEEAAVVVKEAYKFVGQRKLKQIKANLSESVTGKVVLTLLNDDMPFLVDSVSAELSRLGLTPSRVIHPILHMVRDAKGKYVSIAAQTNKAASRESFIRFEFVSLPEGLAKKELLSKLEGILKVLHQVVVDWEPMVERARQTVATLLEDNPKNSDEVAEVTDFLNWLMDGNFIFLGAVDYDFSDGKNAFRIVKNTEQGVFAMDDFPLKPKGYTAMPAESQHFALQPNLLEITKSNTISVVHRPVQMDYIGIKRFDKKGKVIGERRFLGLFTSNVYFQSAERIPIIRRKLGQVMARANFDPNSHDGKALKTILEFAPRDEIFQMSDEDVFNYAIGVLSVESSPQVHLFVRRDIFERFVSCMVFVPRDHFNTALREKIQKILADRLQGEVSDFYTQMTDSPLARVHLIIKTTPGDIPSLPIDALEREIATVTYDWQEKLRRELVKQHGEKESQSIFQAYKDAFSTSYGQYYEPRNGMHDITKIRQIIASSSMGIELYHTKHEPEGTLHLKFYNPESQAALSEILPMLENLGFHVIDEHPFRVVPLNEGVKEVWVRDFTLELKSAQPDLDIEALKPLLEEILLRIWEGQADNDGFNALALLGGFDWRQISLLRAYSRYARQTKMSYSNKAMVSALTANPKIAGALMGYFKARFDPVLNKKKTVSTHVEKFEKEVESLLEGVSNLEEDTILRIFRELIAATWRTNYYQKDANGDVKDYISFKFDSSKVPELPLPRPLAEIFVYSRRVEGIHLRGGKVARGGLRWSDRREDYRTEVLGLMKAQMVKNAVIVPVGSKGGFVLKQAPTSGGREAFMAEGIACYQTFLRGMLDITDNLVKGKIVPPKDVVRHDDDDPYLVVAADKGTATFSDYANAISTEYDFWLDDAFASGGSVGYDHKAMGITAKGAWISVQRHFREMGIDTQTEDFTVMGIGDMSGDVFGNGMLLSEHICLQGAFNHLNIFLDPEPDAKKTFKERKRLFELPRSSWQDYNRKLISKGGGIFSRKEKSIKITPQVRKMLDLASDVKTLSPNALIRAMLKAPVELLWNGGIGTYVKAESETHEQVGDRATNALRINGHELRCEVIGEGGNLGFTQLGRIEYARQGGRINTDAIDNSAGVDCSDHEVNIKIAFRQLLEAGGITMKRRNSVLEKMTDEVSRLVLRDNMLQTQAITTAQIQGLDLLESQARMMAAFEQKGLLNRKVEFLPNSKQMKERKVSGESLTRPELSVLISYAKMSIYQSLLDSSFPDEPYLEQDLLRYFPKQMRKDFAEQIMSHRLKREIVATSVTNSIVNRAGITFFFQIQEDTGLPPCDIARAYIVARDAFGIRELWRDIEEDDNIPASARAEMFAQTSMFLERVVIWMLRNQPQPLKVDDTMAQFSDGIIKYLKICESLITDTLKKAYGDKKQRFIDMKVSPKLASRIARLEIASSALDVLKLAQDHKLKEEQAGKIYFELGARLRLGWLRREASRMPVNSYWERLAAKAMISEMFDQQRRLASTAIVRVCSNGKCPSDALDEWEAEYDKTLSRFRLFIDDLKKAEEVTFPMLVIALRNVEAIG
ncbi:MAG: NAD-glutamate dehydrogenase [Rickettsiales bacterium]|nr:NAD-glutamate dehydrogenase [Rickettsiales bacterium]